MTDWSPVIVVAVLSSDMLRLSLIIATALSVGNMAVDLLFKMGGYIKVRGCLDPLQCRTEHHCLKCLSGTCCACPSSLQQRVQRAR